MQVYGRMGTHVELVGESHVGGGSKGGRSMKGRGRGSVFFHERLEDACTRRDG